MSFRSLSVWTVCLAGLASGVPLLVYADPENQSRKESEAVQSVENKPATETKPAVDRSAKPKSKQQNKPNLANKNGAKNLEITEEREQVALDFVAEHHAKLAKLISPLKTSSPKEYQRAVRELFRTSERLAGIRLKDPVRYELELDAWKIQSHVRLLAARMTMEHDPEIEQELRGVLKKKAEVHVKLLQNERDSLKTRLEQVEQQIERNSKSQEETVQQEYDRLLKRTERERQAIVPKGNLAKPGGNKRGNLAKPSATVGAGKVEKTDK